MRILPVLAAAALAVLAGTSASAVETKSLSAFVRSCNDDSKGCHLMVLRAVQSARNAKFGCIPADVDDDKAAGQLLAWMKGTANGNEKYEKETLEDIMWTGIEEVWPCAK